MDLLLVSIAPVVIIAFYIYFRDKYEKEPIGLLLLSLLAGALIIIPILVFESLLSKLSPASPIIAKAAYEGFIVASFTEEGFKLLAVLILIWKNSNFNEKFDGIVYAVFVSLGFAAIENLGYVLPGGLHVGFLRAITAVPFHAIMGIIMGFYLGQAKFDRYFKSENIIKAFLLPFVFHGVYDFCLMSENVIFLLLWIPFLIYLWKDVFRKMKSHSNDSVFKQEKMFNSRND